MKYRFNINKYFDSVTGLEKTNPLLEIENQEDYGWFFIDEINSYWEYPYTLATVIADIEDVLDGRMEECPGIGMYIYFSDVYKDVTYIYDGTNGKPNNAVEHAVSVIPTIELYEMLRDWRDYLMEWHNKNEFKYAGRIDINGVAKQLEERLKKRGNN
jgi:hypothetical protein